MVEHSRLAAACEFGFKQALAIDPGSSRARDGLHTCLALAAEHALEQGNVDGARAIAAQLRTPPEALLARIEAATEAQAAREAEGAQLLLDEDASVGGWARTASQLTIAVGVMVGGVAMARMGGEGPGYAMPMGIGGGHPRRPGGPALPAGERGLRRGGGADGRRGGVLP
jgi:hypothetical protein